MEESKSLEQQVSEYEKAKQDAELKLVDLRKQIEAKNKAEKPKTIIDRINGMSDILNILDADESKDVLKIDKFDDSEHEFLKNIIKKMRISKVYREGKKITMNDRRYYNWYSISSGSGFVFDGTNFGDAGADAASAARLCFDTPDKSKDFFEKFPDVDKDIILG